MMKVFSIAGSAMSAQSQRLNVVASNLANADSAVSANGQPYRAKQVVFQTTPLSDKQPNVAGVRVSRVIEDQAASRGIARGVGVPVGTDQGEVGGESRRSGKARGAECGGQIGSKAQGVSSMER